MDVGSSQGGTPLSVQDLQPSVGSNRFAVLADDDVDIVTEDPPAPVSMASGERIARPNRARSIQRSTRRRLVLNEGRLREDRCRPSSTSGRPGRPSIRCRFGR